MHAVELRQRVEQLVHIAFRAVDAAGLQLIAGGRDGDVAAFAAELGFAQIVGELVRVVEVGRQQVRVTGIHLPQHRQDRLIAQQRLPQRLHPHRFGQQIHCAAAECVVEHPLPRVELEHRRDRRILEVDEAVEVAVVADLLDRQGHRVQARFGRALLHVGERHVVLARHIGRRPREMGFFSGQAQPDLLPALDQSLVQGVPLVVGGEDVSLPVPLQD